MQTKFTAHPFQAIFWDEPWFIEAFAVDPGQDQLVSYQVKNSDSRHGGQLDFTNGQNTERKLGQYVPVLQ